MQLIPFKRRSTQVKISHIELWVVFRDEYGDRRGKQSANDRPFGVFRVVVGLLFPAIGITKLTGTWDTVPCFAAIGWGQWFRYLTGLIDVIGAVLLFVPRWTFYGVLILTCTIGTATLLAIFKPGYP